MEEFQLDQRLAADCHVVGDLPLNRILLMDDARYPWLIAVPRRPGLIEAFQLTGQDQTQVWQEVTALSEALHVEFAADKMNIAALGNQVPQLHVHVVARYTNDAAWPGPIWGVGQRQPYDQEMLEQRLNSMRMLLADLSGV